MDKAVMFLVYTVIALIAALALFGFMRSYAWKKTDVTKKDGKGNKKRVMTEYGGPVVLFILLLGVALKWGTET
jgi:UDP-N-acetylmuramyl pentapeptide phosphotransferase/UDP-N-acetylglucosamine-1-phosphate transferase